MSEENNFAATTLDREAMSFPEHDTPSEAAAAAGAPPGEEAPARPEREVSGPKWAGTLPGLDREPKAGPPPPPPTVVPAAPAPPSPEPEPTDPVNLAATTLHQKLHVVDAPTAPPIDQLSEDCRVVEAGQRAGLRPGAAGSDAEDRLLKIGLAVIAVLILVTVVAVCAGVVSSLLEPLPEEEAEYTE